MSASKGEALRTLDNTIRAVQALRAELRKDPRYDGPETERWTRLAGVLRAVIQMGWPDPAETQQARIRLRGLRGYLSVCEDRAREAGNEQEAVRFETAQAEVTVAIADMIGGVARREDDAA